MVLPKDPLVPFVVIATGLPGTLRPAMDLLLRLAEATTEWSAETDRRVLTYLARHALVLGDSTIENETWNHETVFYPPIVGERTSRRIAGFPGPCMHVGGLHDGQVLWQRMLNRNWGFYCDRLPRRAEHRFYVEPVPKWLPDVLATCGMVHRRLFVVRDPRSELAEHWMSARRRGALPAILNCIETPLSFAEREANPFLRAHLSGLAEIANDENTMVVRYEDLVGNTADSWRRIRSWLGLPDRAAPPPLDTGHEWPESRWRPLLPASVIAHYRREIGAEMEKFGYAS